MDKSILIFGGGINQVSLIEACNNLGYTSVVIDPNPDAPGKAIAQHFFRVDPNDYEGTKEIALSMKISGIATSQMENPLAMMAKLAMEMGYIFNSPEIIERSTRKHLMKEAFLSHQVPCARGKLFEKPEEFNDKDLDGFCFPVIIKPVDAFSSRGVYRAESMSDLNRYLPETLSFSKSGKILIEEFIEGREFSVESVTFQGKTTVVQITDKIITPFPNVVELGHIQPANISVEEKAAITELVPRAIQALGLDNTVSHTELKLSPCGPVIIEIGPRMGGDFISTWLTRSSCGVNLDEATIKLSVGKEPDLSPRIAQHAFVKYFQLPEGKRFLGLSNMEVIRNLPGLVFHHIFIQPGEVAEQIKHSAMRNGVFIVSSDTRDNLMQCAAEAERSFFQNIKTDC